MPIDALRRHAPAAALLLAACAGAARSPAPEAEVVLYTTCQGTLLVPGTVALVSGAPHPVAARMLVDFLCTAQVEQELIDAGYFACSVRDPLPVRALDVDYARCARDMPRAVELALRILAGP